MSAVYIGQYRIKYDYGPKKWQVIDRPVYKVVHECATAGEAFTWATEHAGLKGAFDASGFAAVGKESAE